MSFDPSAGDSEVAQWLAARQSRLRIVKTTSTPSGQTLDWIPVESQVPSRKIASPPPMKILPAADAQRPVSPVSFELENPIVERGPAGTVPLVRPEPTALANQLKRNAHLRKEGGLKANRKRSNWTPTDPDPVGYFHCIDGEWGTLYGADGFLNVWTPQINSPPGTGDDHSILQFWLQNYEKPQTQSIEGGWTVDQSLNGDGHPHLFVFYTTNGYAQNGDGIGGYNLLQSGFVQYSGVVAPGVVINRSSAVGGAQVFIRMKFQLYAEPITGQLNWWVGVQGGGSFVWIGYYPASLFGGGLGNDAQWIGCGGEVYSSLADPSQTQNQMGSGLRARGGWQRAAFLSNLLNQTDLNGTMANNRGSATNDAGSPYTIELDVSGGGSWGSYMYVGGPNPA